MIHSFCMMKFVLGDMWFKPEKNRQVLVLNVEYYFYDMLLQEQQMPLQVFSRGYYEMLGAIELVAINDLYECFTDVSQEIIDYLKRNGHFPTLNKFQLPSMGELAQKLNSFIKEHTL